MLAHLCTIWWNLMEQKKYDAHFKNQMATSSSVISIHTQFMWYKLWCSLFQTCMNIGQYLMGLNMFIQVQFIYFSIWTVKNVFGTNVTENCSKLTSTPQSINSQVYTRFELETSKLTSHFLWVCEFQKVNRTQNGSESCWLQKSMNWQSSELIIH